MKSIGFAGTAKNTGKTTTASKVLSTLRENGQRIAVTSIGYDGENIDNVTGLPKPLYYLKAGDIIATAEQCLKVSKSSDYKLLETTGIQTILGEIQIIEIIENHTYTIAGPNRRTDLEQVLGRLEALRVDVTLIDGALNRIVPMICADGIVISTGASYDEDIASTAQHIDGIAHLFTYNRLADMQRMRTIQLELQSGEMVHIPSTSLITDETFESIKSYLGKGICRLAIPGACYPAMLARLLENLPDDIILKEVVLGNPLFLIASGDPVDWKATLTKFEQRGVMIGYIETLPLMFVTVSPFYPRYLQKSHTYEPAYVDARELIHEIKSQIPHVTVINVEEINPSELHALLQ